MARKKALKERIEPRFPDIDDDRAPRVAGERRAKGSDKGKSGGEKKPSRRSKESKSRRRSLLGGLIYWGFVVAVWGVIGVGGVFIYYGSQLPHIENLAIPKRPPNIAILGADGTLIANRGDTGGAAVHLQDLPPYLPRAFIAIEDRRFYSHWGVDPIGIARAIVNDVLGRGAMQGGSTLTQQLAKNLFLTQERTFSRKIQEAILALWLEHKYSKDKILELYLNRVYFGSGAYGVDAAAEKYFGHPAKDVTLPEAAMLAGLMKAPSKLAPNHNLPAAIERANEVIAAMAAQGFITRKQAEVAIAHPAHAVRGRDSSSLNYAADYVMDVLDDTIGAIDEDIVVTSTINPAMQAAAERALDGVLDKDGARYRVSQGALVSMDPGGAIRALVGGRDYGDSQFDRAVAAHRQPGSSFKPFVYLTALEHGLTPDTVRDDAPIDVKGWQPENASRRYMGPVTLTTALAMSLNTVAVRLGLEVGPRAIIQTAHRLGIVSDLQSNASIALGTSEVTPLELVTAYVPFANGGVGVQPHIITRVRTADGKLLYARKGSSNGRVVDPAYVGMMNSMLEQTLIIGTARRASVPGWQAAGKTGTSQDYRDAWFVGYTSRLVTGVWVGNDDNSPTRKASGGNLPAEIWSSYMRDALRGMAVAGLPTGGWRSQGAPGPGPAASLWPFSQPAQNPPPHMDAGNSSPPLLITGAGAPVAAPPRGDGAPVPPEDIPGAPPGRRLPPEPDNRNVFQKLFGGFN
ncbi:PBP1A family penicillin-binding protein [Rhodoblastus acidophilus]|uniref:peptidoglycan glycosyltransferase n=1 Tax=Candidatus Rhodoblastus alkanivorans TaxID=2954117 RepID=A0ABS9Z2C3_9HYPH|nr:PBP1A family penicillin-binding protein [Candidatus Rhodoblastus alkanivorans]MCI4677465.1 PBP1A family penicillin-binding protein [Candidatus Rhodoblastus alkanivorans]MCI4681824.1 PBP1A family penicillin-binding protein [Candidatus Rhodoblastus alkanivorans]MDI4642874.1 PBP1A family penicillin-binding protein [Rhodoblastus acidophilus]